MNPKGHSSQVFPHIMDMSIHLDMDLRNRSCQPCTSDHPLGPQCCGMCGFWENLRYKNVDRQPWVAPCNIRDVSATHNLQHDEQVCMAMRDHLQYGIIHGQVFADVIVPPFMPASDDASHAPSGAEVQPAVI